MKRILVVVSNGPQGGTDKYRMTDPNIMLDELYPDEYKIDVSSTFDFNDIESLKKYDAVIFQKIAGQTYEKSKPLIEFIKSLGIKVIIDTDDYWVLDHMHPYYQFFMKNNIASYIIETLKVADFVTCSTEALKEKIYPINKNVFVIPNAINPEEKQFVHNPTESKRFRIGYVAGSSHLQDLKLIDGVVNILSKEFKNDLQFVLCGFDLRGVSKYYEVRGKKIPISVWANYEAIVTDNYRTVDSNDRAYLNSLLLFDRSVKMNDDDTAYKRVWTKPVNEYASNYNDLDLVIAPLKDFEFNTYKSNLKVLESGFHKLPIIASEFGPYKQDLVSAYKGEGQYGEGNSLLVKPNKNAKEWAKFIKYLAYNRDEAKRLGLALYDTVKEKYDLRNVSTLRHEVYQTFF